MPDSRPQWRRTRRLRADARHRRSPPRDEFCRACPRHRRHPRSCSSSWNRRLLARTDEMARTELDEADKTVMGASRTGSYEVTDVPPGDVQWTGPPRADRRIDCKTAKRRSGGGTHAIGDGGQRVRRGGVEDGDALLEQLLLLGEQRMQ